MIAGPFPFLIWRRLEASTRLAKHLDWPGLEQVCRIERRRWIRGKEEHEVAYAITSAPRDQADANTLGIVKK